LLVEVEPGISVDVCDVGSGPPVVLLAGFGFDHEVWDRQVRELSDDHRVVAVSLRGTGASTKPKAGYGMPRLAQDVVAVLERLDLRDVALVGWSFGGLVAFRIAAVAPQRVARLALVGSNGVRASATDGFPFGAPEDALCAALVHGESEDRLRARRRAVAGGFYAPPDPDVLDWLMRIQLRMPSWSAVACFDTYARAEQRELMSKVRMPVVQMVGEHDRVAPVTGARWLNERLSDATLVELPDCGHTPMIEAPEPFGARLSAFAAG